MLRPARKCQKLHEISLNKSPATQVWNIAVSVLCLRNKMVRGRQKNELIWATVFGVFLTSGRFTLPSPSKGQPGTNIFLKFRKKKNWEKPVCAACPWPTGRTRFPGWGSPPPSPSPPRPGGRNPCEGGCGSALFNLSQTFFCNPFVRNSDENRSSLFSPSSYSWEKPSK